MRAVSALLSLMLLTTVSMAQNSSIFPGKTDSLLIVDLRSNYYPTTPKDYNEARDSMYTSIDVDATDSLTCVYSGLRAKADGSRTPSNGSLTFNTEHTWPQSFYDNEEPMRGDIHHLYPTWSSPNQSRSNHPFAEVQDNLTTSWWYWANGGSINTIPSSNINSYSEYYNDTFEPREDHKGNVARAIFYFWTMYQNNTHVVNDSQDNHAFFDGMKSTLYQWHQQDPVDAEEVARSLEIEEVQGNRNPFIHDTTLVRRAYFPSTGSSSSTMPDIYISEVYEANGGTVKYVELFNTTESSIDLETGNYRLLRYSNANTSPSSISLSGSIGAKSFFVIGNDNATSGVQTVFGEGMVDQNNSQISHTGNDKYALVRSVSDTLDAFGKDNIGNSSNFASNQVAYRIQSAMPNNGNFGQTSISANGSNSASGFWKVYDVSSSNGNATLVGSPGYNSGIESPTPVEAQITGNAGWKLLAIPAHNATLAQISDDNLIQGIGDSNAANVYLYNSSGGFSAPASLSSEIANGEGLLVYFFDNDLSGSSSLPSVLDTNLDEPTSDVSVTLNTSTKVGNSYFTLIGNPFQSNLNLNNLSFNGSAQANVHVLKNGLYEAVPRSSAIVRAWQAFFVETPEVQAATQVTIPTSAKTENQVSVHAFSKRIADEPEIRFSLKSSSTFDTGCVIRFNDNALFKWDPYDAQKLSPTRPDFSILYCAYEGSEQSVLALPKTITESTTIPISIHAVNTQPEHILQWSVSRALLQQYTITLIDRDTQSSMDLSEQGELDFKYESNKTKKHFADIEIAVKSKNDSPRFVLQLKKKSEQQDIPISFEVRQNYPNPFNPITTLEYTLPENGEVNIQIYDVLGIQVESLLSKALQNSGTHSVSWNASSHSSGVYFARISFNGLDQFVRMLLIK